MRRTDFWFKMDPAAWLDGTRDMSAELRGVYVDVICILHVFGAPIRDDDRWFAHQLHMSTRAWRSARRGLVARGKLRVVETAIGAALTNDRVAVDIETRANRCRTNAEIAANRERTRRENRKSACENNEPGARSVSRTVRDARACLDSDVDLEFPPQPPARRGERGRGLTGSKQVLHSQVARSTRTPWVATLRDEGAAAAVIDGLIAPLVDANLDPMNGHDPIGWGRQVCRDLANDPPAVIALVAEAALSERGVRLPTIPDVRRWAGAARTDHQRRCEAESRLAQLKPIACDPEATAGVDAAIRAERDGAVVADAWLVPFGVAAPASGQRVIVVTAAPATQVENHVGGLIRNAVRRALDRAVADVRFVQGRPVFADDSAGAVA